jgi:multidrug efflux pump subunit AcrB
MSIVEFSIKQRVLVNMFMLTVFIGGLMCANFLRREIFVSISTDQISVRTIDVTLNAPEDIERLVTVPIEDELRDVEEVKKVLSISAPNSSTIYLELYDGVDVQAVLNDVRQRVDQAQVDVPDSAEPSVVEEMDFPFPVMIVAMSYERGANKLAMKELADDLEDQFRALPGVANVLVAGLNDREVWVEVDPFRARAFGLSLGQISQAVRANNLDMPGGRIKGGAGGMTVRVLEQIDEDTWRGLGDIVVKRVGDQVLRLRDVATVQNTFEEDTTLGRVNLKPAITFTLNKQASGDTVAIATKAKEIIAKTQKRLPPGVELSFSFDTSKYVKKRLGTMVQNGIISLCLVGVMLLLFMNARISLLVVSGLLVSFFGTFIYLYFIGNSFNMISLFSLILVLGLLVDDAIVVCENAYRYMEQGLSPYDAALKGTTEVMWPVIGTVSTTIVAFLPLLLTTGLMGKFVAIIPQVVSVALLLSLVEALFILPSHLVDFVRPEHMQVNGEHAAPGASWWAMVGAFFTRCMHGLRRGVEYGLSRVIEYYHFLLKLALRCRYVVVVLAVLLFISAIVLPASGILRFRLFHADYADRFLINLEMPSYASLEETSRVVLDLERDLATNMPKHEIASIITTIGLRMENEFVSKLGDNQAGIIFDIDEEHPDCRRPTPILNDLRQIVHRHAPKFIMARVDKEEGGPPVGRPINAQIMGDDFEVLQKIADEYKAYLATVPGVVDISDDFDQNKREVHIDIDDGRAALSGLDVEAVGNAILAAFQGREASVFRWGNDEVTVRVKSPDKYSASMEDIHSFRIVNAAGFQVPLGSIATIEHAPGYASIFRQDRKRVITVYADVDDTRITSREANLMLQDRFRDITERYPGYTVSYTGEEEDTQESLRSMAIAGVIAFILIFAIIAGILNSFLQPVIILSVIPMGLVGVTYGFMMFQLPIGFMAMMGTIGLAGIIVNDGIVMMSFINDHRGSWQQRLGLDARIRTSTNRHLTSFVRWSSLMRCGVLRFRPILLTTITTIAGMSTVAFVRSGQEQFIAPMALSIVCGMAFGTTLTLILIPCLYAILDDIVHFFMGEGELPPAVEAQVNPETGWPGAV